MKSQSLKLLENQMSTLAQLSVLAQFNGRVIVTYVSDSKFQPPEEGYLKGFVPKSNVEISPEEGVKRSFPLLGNGCAVKQITDKGGNVLYENPLVKETYPLNSDEIRRKCGFTSKDTSEDE